MSDVPIKSVVLNGNLKDNNYLSYNLANSETRHGLWQVAVKDITIAIYSEINVIGQISTNLIRDLRIRHNKTETFNPIISTVLLKGKNGDKKLQQFELVWFQITSSDTEIKIYITNAETNTIINADCAFFITLLLQQIK